MDGFLPTFTRRNLLPPPFRSLTWGMPSASAGIPERVIIPLQDSPGSPCEATVQVGEKVRTGQQVGFGGAPPARIFAHASTSGKVEQIGPLPHPLGFYSHSVLIIADGKDEHCEATPLGTSGVANHREKVFEAFREMGIPLNYPLLHQREFRIPHLLINATEFEPYLTSRHQLIKEHAQRLLGGLEVLINACSASRATILLEKKQASLINTLKRACKDSIAITIRGTDRHYPETAIWLLAHKLFSKKSPRTPHRSPQETMPVDPSSLIAIYDAWFSGTPFIEQLVTIVGSAVGNPHNRWVKIGTPFAYLIQEAGGSCSNLGRLTLGGPLMGIPQHHLEAPLIKKAKGLFASASLLFDEHRQSRFYKRTSCIKCAKCVDVCPVSIIPNLIADYIDNKLFSDAEQWGVFLCAECGLCEYVCPSRIPLLELMKLGKVSLGGEQSLLTQRSFKMIC